MTSGLALSLTLAALSGCADGEPNGKNGVLYFHRPPHAMARYLENSILLPSSYTIYSGKLEFPKTLSFNLSGTTLDVKVAEGIELLETRFETQQKGPSLWRIRLRCMTPPGERTELSVRVMDGKHVRYEDAIDISCVEPKKLLVTVPRSYRLPEKAPNTVLQGGDFRADVQVWSNTVQLSGTGLEVVDPQGPISLVSQSPIWPDEFVFRAERLGKEPLLKAGPLTVPVPVEVVPNEGWSLRARTEYRNTSGRGFLYFAGQAEFSDGGIAAGLHGACTFTQTPEGGELSLDRHKECAGEVSGAPDSGELCVEALGQKACSTY
jgi:hypothetical protein